MGPLCIPVDCGKTTGGFASEPKREVQLYKSKYSALGRGGGCLLFTAFLGSVVTRAGKSCQHIITVGDATGDGEYWIDPDGSGDSFKAFCDMTTDGGMFHFCCLHFN